MAGMIEFSIQYSMFLQEPRVSISQAPLVPPSLCCWGVPPSVPCGLLGFQHGQWSSGHVLAPVGKAIQRHLHTAHPEARGLQLQCYSLACRRSFFFKLRFRTCAFCHDIMNIILYRMEKVKIIWQVQQERKGLFSWESKHFES